MKHQTKTILGGFMGNVVEAYDVSICYFLSSELSRVLMGDNQGNPTVVLGLIFLAYLAKPIGAFILGLFSDLYGRKNVLMASILIMGISTALIGLIPSFNQIGLYAAGLLLILRTIQSMALGSEFLNSASFLVESGDDSKRGFRGCWSSVGVKAGYLLACIIVEITHSSGTQLPLIQDWLWRIPFLLAILTTLMGVFIRYKMPESLAYIVYYAERKKPTTKAIYSQAKEFIRKNPFLFNYAFFASFLSVATGFFYYLYIPLHALQYSQLTRSFIMSSTTMSLAFVTFLIPLFGWLSDKCDRLQMLTSATISLLVLSYPFMHAVNHGNATYFVLMQLVISIPCACYYSVSSVLLTELFPLQIRCTALSIVFSIAASLASGLPPLLSDYLVRKTQLVNSPCLIMITLSCIVLVNVIVLAQRYRLGVNQYNIAALNEEKPIFTIHYQNPLID
ncbi:Proline porter II [Legionella massiliensis]|uniref:Proline porter II n=1 Tax=Legionella massiliensis TaxID=1034943 RepID=A0A078KYB8_9GAMM|nr:MFS transporter [Legionella massiliensis]CDZ77911.1 Proline porter II [Legionella massiliensis]CEE13649.1 Proline/betaine transporter [Legionella massiliensis]